MPDENTARSGESGGARIAVNRGVLPIAIAAPAEDVRGHKFQPWELVYDQVSGIHRRRHRHGEEPRWVVCRIRVDEPRNMVAEETVPFELRDIDAYEQRVRDRRAYVNRIADRIVSGDGAQVDLAADFDLEREVLDELWRRWREVTADDFLRRSLAATEADRGS